MGERVKPKQKGSEFEEQTREIYKKILAKAQSDERIIGFVLGGGRGKGFSTKNSDYDILVIVSDADRNECTEAYQKEHYSTEAIDIRVFSLTEFRAYAVWGTSEHVYAYNFTHLKAEIDRTGEIQKIMKEKGRIPKSEVHSYTADQLDGFINGYYRALKNGRDKNRFASHLDASESLPFLVGALFGREGRLKPYNKYLEWELKQHPLEDIPWDSQTLVGHLKEVLATGSIETLKEMYKAVETFFVEKGYEGTIHGWDRYDLG